MIVRSGSALPFMRSTVGAGRPLSAAGGLGAQRCVDRGSKLNKRPQQVLGKGMRRAKGVCLRRSSSAQQPRGALIKGGLRAIASAASGLKSSLKICLAPHLERLKEQDARYQQALEDGADYETLASLEEEMRSTTGTIQGITDELTKMYDELVDTVFLLYSGLTGGEFTKVVSARLRKVDPGLFADHRMLDFSSQGLGLDNLGFRYGDVNRKLGLAFDILSAYEDLAVEKPGRFGKQVPSSGFQRVSGVTQLGVARGVWRVDTLA